MSFFKKLLNVVNPLPSIIKANKSAGSFGEKLLNVVNPAGAAIKDNSGLSDLRLSTEYKALQSGGDVLTEKEKQDAQTAKAAFDEAEKKKTANVFLMLGAGLLGLFLFMSQKPKKRNA
ncbi:MAG: hypothetical protein ACTHMM_13425 [Agriterribacter sp.]